MTRYIVGVLFVSFIYLGNLALADCAGEKIYSDANLAIYLGPLNRNEGPNSVVYRATNQRLIMELCLDNLSTRPQQISVDVCATDNCQGGDDLFDIRYLAPWYRDSNVKKSVFPTPDNDQELVPELLVHDPALIQNDRERRISRIRTKSNNATRHISNKEYETLGPRDKHGRVVHSADQYQVTDAARLQTIPLTDSSRVFLIQKQPADIAPVRLTMKDHENTRTLTIPVYNLAFALDDQPVTNAIYYRGQLNRSAPALASELKTTSQLRDEFANMASLGIRYPTAYIYNDDYDLYFSIRNNFDFGKDKLFIFDGKLIEYLKQDEWAKYDQRMQKLTTDPALRQFGKLYFYLYDEPKREMYERIIRKAAPIAKKHNAELYLAGHADQILHYIVAGTVYITAYQPSAALARRVHDSGGLIFSYANPQIGVYQPKQLRFNYGFEILNNNYDGIMPYAYQHSFGSQWSDQDGQYREHMLSYPTSNGIIDTIHGLELENAITDQRYFSTWQRARTTRGATCNFDTSLSQQILEGSEDEANHYRWQLALQLERCHNAPSPPNINIDSSKQSVR